MESIASELKSQREKQNLSLSQIAADTHISLRHLQSLEEGRFDDLPGGIYNRAFLRAYCESLNLDQLEILQRYDSEISPRSEKTPKYKTQIQPQTPSIRIHPIAVWSILLLISAMGVFLSRKWISSVFSPYFSNSSTRSATYLPPKQPPVAALSNNNAPVLSTSSPSQVPQESPASLLESSLESRGITQKAIPAGDSSSTTAPQLSSVVSSYPLLLEVTGKEQCWISVMRDGNSVFRRVLEPGEVQSFSAEEKLFIIVGNAGGIGLKINGKSAKPLGKSGEVIKLLIDQTTLSDLIDRSAG
jgi:cytoskeletal protein RodZ